MAIIANYNMRTPSNYFRANVAALIVRDGQVLGFQRIDHPESWQCPQGGIDVGETPDVAIWRELQEETGLTSMQVELVGECPYWASYTYDHPSPFADCIGQTQRWFLFRLTGSTDQIILDQTEFSAWQWFTFDELSAVLPPMKQQSFTQVRTWAEGLL